MPTEGVHPLFQHFILWLGIMEEQDLVLQIHGEETQGDIFDREALFIDTHV